MMRLGPSPDELAGEENEDRQKLGFRLPRQPLFDLFEFVQQVKYIDPKLPRTFDLRFIEAGCRGRENPGLRAGDESYPALSYEFLNTITA